MPAYLDANRRALLWRAGAAAAALAVVPGTAFAQNTPPPAPVGGDATTLLTLAQMVEPVAGQTPPRSDGIRIEVAPLADNGHVVPLRVVVDSPMTEADHVTEIVLLSQRNPVTRMATFRLGPWSGRAEVATRVRLAGTQVVVALARSSGGGWRMASAEVVVTESACLDMTG